jgi:hypothetical protein
MLTKISSAMVKWVTTLASDLISYTAPTLNAVMRSLTSKLAEQVSPKDFGAAGDGIVDDTLPVYRWLMYLAANPTIMGVVNGGVYAIDTIAITAQRGLIIRGSATFKALGVARAYMVLLADVSGHVDIDGITFDGSNIAARPFNVQNLGTSAAGTVHIGPRTRFINARNNAPRVDIAAGCFVQGMFDRVVFAGEVDGVDNTLTSGAISIGAWFDWSGVAYIKSVVVTSEARIKNVKNSNVITADADGLQCMGPTNQYASLTIEPGAYFENCKGRSIKSQVTNNAITGPVIIRTAYDGLAEVDCQYGGGYCTGARIFHTAVRVNYCVVSTTRVGLRSDFTMRDNVLLIVNQPTTPTTSLCFFWGVDATDAIKQEALLCVGNKVLGGSVDYLVTVYAANVVDTNRLIVRDNYAHAIAVAYMSMQVVSSNRAQLTVVFESNACRTQCVGAQVISGGQLIVESDRNNSKISALPHEPVVIAADILTLYAGHFQRVATEGGAGYDNITTISGGTYADGAVVVFRAAYSGYWPMFVHGTGNIRLTSPTFELNSMQDSLTLCYDAPLGQWHEVCRANIV